MKQRPKGLDQQGRFPEAAHAASEVDEYGLEPPPKVSVSEVVVIVIVVCAGIVCAAAWMGQP